MTRNNSGRKIKYLSSIIFSLLCILLLYFSVKDKEKWWVYCRGTILSIDDLTIEIQGDISNKEGLRENYYITNVDSVTICDSDGNEISSMELYVGEYIEVIFEVFTDSVDEYNLKEGGKIHNIIQINIRDN